MNKFHYDEIRQMDDYRRYLVSAGKYIERILPVLAEHYPVEYAIEHSMGRVDGALISQLPQILWATRGNLRGKRILGLGSGGTKKEVSLSESTRGLTPYQPWVGRALHYLGVRFVGIDKHLADARFPHYGLDLLNHDIEKFLGGFDVVNAVGLFDAVMIENGEQEARRLKREIESKLGKILKPNGKFIYDGVVDA